MNAHTHLILEPTRAYIFENVYCTKLYPKKVVCVFISIQSKYLTHTLVKRVIKPYIVL